MDEADFEHDRSCADVRNGDELLVAGCRKAAARELHEETGIHIMNLARIEPKALRSAGDTEGDGLVCEYKKRLFFSLEITDDDFPKDGNTLPGIASTSSPVVSGTTDGVVKLKLSREHSGYLFDNNMGNIMARLKKHSGGACSFAVDLIMKSHEQVTGGEFSSSMFLDA